MSRKDYCAIAAALKWVKPSNPLTTPQNHKTVLEAMSKEWTWTVEFHNDVRGG